MGGIGGGPGERHRRKAQVQGTGGRNRREVQAGNTGRWSEGGWGLLGRVG